MPHPNHKEIQTILKRLDSLYKIQQMEQTQEWQMFRQEVLGFLVTLPDYKYGPHELASETALRNEMLRHRKDGLSSSLTFIGDEIKANEEELKRLKE